MAPPARSTEIGSWLNRRSPPELPGGLRGAGRQGAQLGPSQGWMDAAAEAAVRTGDHVLPAPRLGVPHDPVGDHLRMFQHIGLMSDHSRDHLLTRGELHIFPNFP